MIFFLGWVRHRTSDRQRIFRAGPPCYGWRNISGGQGDFGVIARALIRRQRLPIGNRLVHRIASRGHRPALKIVKCGLIRRDHAGTGTSLDGHVANRHPAFHAQAANHRAGKFDHMTGATGGANLADDSQNHVLGRDPGAQFAINRNTHVFGRLLDQGLGGQHMFDLGRADAEGQRPKGAVGCGVRIAANNGHAGQGKALFRANHMDDALTNIIHREIGNAKFSRIGFQGFNLNTALFIGNANTTVGGRDVVIGHRQGAVRGTDRATSVPQPFKGLRACHLMDKMPVDINQAGTVVLLMHHMGIPDFVKKCFWSRHIILPIAAGEEVISRPVWQFKRMTPRDSLFFQRYAPPYRYGHASNRAWPDAPGHGA